MLKSWRNLREKRIRANSRSFRHKSGLSTKGWSRNQLGAIYYVLKRHNWQKEKPRGRHPKKASPLGHRTAQLKEKSVLTV